MFTGIIKEVGKVALVKPDSLVISASSILSNLSIGDSISVNGVCMTVTSYDSKAFSVNVMHETLRRSNLGNLSAGNRVNLEQALTLASFIGGHLVQGHIDDTGKLIAIRRDGDARILKFEVSSDVMRYVVKKGFIAVDGMSLTVISRTSSTFEVSIVTHTYENTNLGDRKTGDRVNLEVDIIAKYVEQLANSHGKGVTTEFLREHGFSLS